MLLGTGAFSGGRCAAAVPRRSAKRRCGASPFALGLTPLPAPLAQTAREWTPGELFWVVKHGIKMTGMPAWRFRLDDVQTWALVAFMRERLALLSPMDYRALPSVTLEEPQPVQGEPLARLK